MSHELYQPVVAKFGGYAAAQPEAILTREQHPNIDISIMVISAPGCDEESHEKLTDTLINGGSFDVVHARFAKIASRLDPIGENAAIQTFLQELPEDYNRWLQNHHARVAFGEYASAKLYAAYSGREFVDAAHIIRLDSEGNVNFAETAEVIRKRFQPRVAYVVPGFYGRDPNGRVRTLGRNSSDTTGAIIANILNAPRYYNFSNQSGWMSGPPDIVNNASVIDHLTYREARELVQGGYEVLAPDAFRYLMNSGVETIVGNVFEPEQQGTLINETRDCRQSPIAGVTGKMVLHGLTVERFGMNEEVGGTREIFDTLYDFRVPYSSLMTATDSVTVLSDSLRGFQRDILRVLQKSPENQAHLHERGLVHIVGEGMKDGSPLRNTVTSLVRGAFALADLESGGCTDDGSSVGISLFVNPESLRNEAEPNAFRLAHKVLQHLIQRREV